MEKDYRQIPWEALNSNIPTGRGMVKWQPFATMPEQYEKVASMMEHNAMVEKPIINDDIADQNERLLKELLNGKAIVRYWNHGFEVTLDCTIEYLDSSAKIVIASKNNELIHIPFDTIYEVQNYSYYSQM